MPKKKVDLAPVAMLPAGSTLYRAGTVGKSNVWFTPDPKIAESYASIYAERVRTYETAKNLELARFDKVWNVKLALVKTKLVEPSALQMASNLDLSNQVCAAGYDGWVVEREEHLTRLPSGGVGIDRARPLIGPDVMLCKRNVKATRALNGPRRARKRR
jgi:hypothetical protein